MRIDPLPTHCSGNRPLGVWDLRVAPLTLGGLLILVEELQIERILHGALFADICIVGDASLIFPSGRARIQGQLITPVGEGISKGSTLLSAVTDLESIGACYLCSTGTDLGEFLRTDGIGFIPWPRVSEKGCLAHKYASTLYIQQFYLERGFIPFLSVKSNILKWAARFITDYVRPSIPVVIHLKNKPNGKRCSNADMKVWREFFWSCYRRYDAKFILIGGDDRDEELTKLPNVLVAREVGSDLSRDLALIQTGFLFMGMSSGPCNMAIFGRVPYVIYKHPDHDAEEMEMELGGTDHFPFATTVQRFLRMRESVESLSSEFSRLYASANRSDWEARVAQLK